MLACFDLMDNGFATFDFSLNEIEPLVATFVVALSESLDLDALFLEE